MASLDTPLFMEKRNILVSNSDLNPERIWILKFVDKQDFGANSESKSMQPERIRSQFFVTPLVSGMRHCLWAGLEIKK